MAGVAGVLGKPAVADGTDGVAAVEACAVVGGAE